MENQNMTSQKPESSTNGAVSPSSVTSENKSFGALIGSIIIVIILILGGFYLWSTKVAPVNPSMMGNEMPITNGTAEEMTATEQSLSQPDPVLSQMTTVGKTDEVTVIDTDLKTTELDNLDSGI